MKLAVPVRSILKPSIISMVAVLASFSAWLFPSFGLLRKGFNTPSRFYADSAVILICWYLLIFVSFTLGERIALLAYKKRRHSPPSTPILSTIAYVGFTITTAVGLITLGTKVLRSLSLPEIAVLIAAGQANRLSEVFQEDYTAGLISLRYAVIYSTSLALYRMIRLKQYSLLNLANVLMFAIIVINSRLIFVATFFVLMTICNISKTYLEIKFIKLCGILVVAFSLLAAINYSRNASYYERMHLSFGLAGLSEILAYLGSPFQAAIGSANVIGQLVAGGGDTYRKYVDIEEVLNTNSAFVELHQQMGYLCWGYIALMCSAMGFAFESMALSRNALLLLPAGAILYASAELWRLDLFQQGIFITFLVTGIGLPALIIACQRISQFFSSTYRPSFSGQDRGNSTTKEAQASRS